MNTKSRCAPIVAAALIAATAVGFHAPAAAQVQRTFPQLTLRGAMVFGDYPNVTLNGRVTQLSPASKVRDQSNRIVMASTLAGQKLLVHFTWLSSSSQIGDVWVLTPDEAQVSPWPRTLDEARTWIYDPTTLTWTKP
jgi:hypothetical protein